MFSLNNIVLYRDTIYHDLSNMYIQIFILLFLIIILNNMMIRHFHVKVHLVTYILDTKDKLKFILYIFRFSAISLWHKKKKKKLKLYIHLFVIFFYVY